MRHRTILAFISGFICCLILTTVFSFIKNNFSDSSESLRETNTTTSDNTISDFHSPTPTANISTPSPTQSSVTSTPAEMPVEKVTPSPVLPEGDIVSTDKSLYSYEEMLEDIQQLQQRYPEQLSSKTISLTADNREIVDVILGNSNADQRILIQASIHGREYINSLLVMKQIEEFLKGYDHNTYGDIPYSQLLNSVCFHIIPMSNPDGVTISQFGPGKITSSELQARLLEYYSNDSSSENEVYWKRWKANAEGVDLNRNFDAGWEEYQGNSSPASEKYKGESPASEPETQAILAIAQEQQVCCVISYHSSGNIIYWDYGSSGDIYTQDKALVELVSSITGYPSQSSIQSNTDAAGCSDYFVLKEGIPAVTIENGTGTAPLGIEEFSSIWYANQNLLPALAKFYMS